MNCLTKPKIGNGDISFIMFKRYQREYGWEYSVLPPTVTVKKVNAHIHVSLVKNDRASLRSNTKSLYNYRATIAAVWKAIEKAGLPVWESSATMKAWAVATQN